MLRLVLSSLFVAAAAVVHAAPPASFAEFDRRAREGERLNVVFFGASLTWGANATDPQLTSYRAVVGNRLTEKYPKAHFRFFDAAIGGTGSQLGVFRLERDVLARKPDLVFLDFSANDGINDKNPETFASYEAILRTLILRGIPVVQVILPFQWDVEKGTTDGMVRRDGHRGLHAAYRTAVGDAIKLAQIRVKSGETTIKELWPVDGVHPGDKGYELFADAAWEAFEKAVASKQICAIPPKMIYRDTYMASRRIELAKLDPLPAGWTAGRPHVVSAYFDMLMSRWLDGEAIATGKSAARLKFKINGSMALLFGESTPKSGQFRVYVDGKLIERKSGDGKPLPPEFDGGKLGKMMNGNAHLVEILVTGLAPAVEHTLEIEPVLEDGQELRLGALGIAGGAATATIEK